MIGQQNEPSLLVVMCGLIYLVDYIFLQSLLLISSNNIFRAFYTEGSFSGRDGWVEFGLSINWFI